MRYVLRQRRADRTGMVRQPNNLVQQASYVTILENPYALEFTFTCETDITHSLRRSA